MYNVLRTKTLFSYRGGNIWTFLKQTKSVYFLSRLNFSKHDLKVNCQYSPATFTSSGLINTVLNGNVYIELGNQNRLPSDRDEEDILCLILMYVYDLHISKIDLIQQR